MYSCIIKLELGANFNLLLLETCVENHITVLPAVMHIH